MLGQALGPAAIPQFHFPQGRPLSPDQQQSLQSKLEQLFSRHEAGLSVPAFKQLMVEVGPLCMPFYLLLRGHVG